MNAPHRIFNVSTDLLNSVSKSNLSLNDFPSPGLLAIADSKVNRQDRHKHNDEQIACDCSIDAGTILWFILCPKHQAARNAANASKANKGSAAESPLPLATNVVCLISHARGNVCVGTSGHQEDTEILYSVVCSVSLQGVSG
jgi:hypothetical protein